MDSFPDFSRIHSMRSMLAFMRQYRRNYFTGSELYRAFALEKSNKVHDLANEIMKDKSLRAFYDEARSARSQAAANFRQLDPAGYSKMKLEHLRKVADRKNAQEQAKAFTAPWPGWSVVSEYAAKFIRSGGVVSFVHDGLTYQIGRVVKNTNPISFSVFVARPRGDGGACQELIYHTRNRIDMPTEEELRAAVVRFLANRDDRGFACAGRKFTVLLASGASCYNMTVVQVKALAYQGLPEEVGTYTPNESIDSLRANSLAKSESSFASKIDSVLELVRNTLLEKNKAYGDSASSPMRIFSKSDADEGIRVRIDDKLSRIAKGDGSGDEDAVLDLIGYLVLLRTRSIE